MRYEIAGCLLELQCEEEWIHERLKLFYTEKRGKSPDLTIQVSEEEPPRPKEQQRILYSATGMPLYLTGDDWCFTWQEENTVPFLALSTKDWTKTILYVKQNSIRYLQESFPAEWQLRLQVQIMHAVMQAFRYGILSLGGLYLHGILAEYQGHGLGFSAASGVGKTTHVNLWREAGYPLAILNGDNFVIRKEGDTVYAYGIPWCGSSEQFSNKKVPYWGTVFLEQHEENRVSRLDLSESYLYYLDRSFLPRFDRIGTEKGLTLIEELVPISNSYLLRCRPDVQAAEILKEEVDRGLT